MYVFFFNFKIFFTAQTVGDINKLWGIHAKRVANMSKDIQLARRIRGERT